MRRQPDPAFLAALRAQQEPLLRAARLLTGDWPAAEQLLRDTLVWAVGAWQSLAASGAAPVRLRQRMISAYLADSSPGQDFAQEEDEAADLLRAGDLSKPHSIPPPASFEEGLSVLSPEDRVIVVSRYYLSLSAAEIGEVLDVADEEVDAIAVSVLAELRRSRADVGGSE
jgi:DNA-directed RNA polymerase specialized sigma24 family protein